MKKCQIVGMFMKPNIVAKSYIHFFKDGLELLIIRPCNSSTQVTEVHGILNNSFTMNYDGLNRLSVQGIQLNNISNGPYDFLN